MKNFTISEPVLNDINHADGSKSYQLFYGDYVLIKRKEVVDFIEDILSENHTGYSYMKKVQDAFDNNFLTQDEYQKVIQILD